MKGKRLTTSQTAVVLAVLMLFSKLLGLLRELVLANSYGVGPVTDAYSMALSIPNDIFAAVMLSASTAYIPVFSQRVEQSGKDAGDRLTSAIINRLWIASGIVCLLGCIFAGTIVNIFAPGFDPAAKALTVFYLRIAFVLVFFSVSKNIQAAYLDYNGCFISQRLLGFIENFFIIAFTIISFRLKQPRLLILGITLGGAVIAAGHFIISTRQGYRHRFIMGGNEGASEILKLAFPVFLGNCAVHINVLIDRIIASGLGEGSVSALHYGEGITDAMNALTIGVVATVIYPMLSKAFSSGNMERASSLSSSAVGLCLVIMLPASLCAVVFAKPVIRAVFERGVFGASATELVSSAFVFYVAGLLFRALNTVLLRVYYSLRDTKTTVVISLCCVVLNIALDLILSRYIGIGGLALATSISAAAGLVMRLIILPKKHPEISINISAGKVIRTVIFSAAAVGVAKAAYEILNSFTNISQIINLVLAIIIAIVLYYLEIYFTGAEELTLLRKPFSRK